MKIQFEEDFIYLASGYEATLILRNCNKNCAFCPACKLKPFYNSSKLNMSFDFKHIKFLKIYGSATSPFLETFIGKINSLNPNLRITLIVCRYEFTQKLEFEFKQIIHPEIQEISNTLPQEFILPAYGDIHIIQAFALRYFNDYPDIPIKLTILDSGANINFWEESKVEEIQKLIDSEDFRI